MLLKIRIRTILLSIFENCRLGLDHPLANYIYYDGLNMWLNIVKKQSGSATDKAVFIIENTIYGYSAEKMEAAMKSDKPYTLADMKDKALVKKIESLADEDIRHILIGAAAGYKYGV